MNPATDRHAQLPLRRTLVLYNHWEQGGDVTGSKLQSGQVSIIY